MRAGWALAAVLLAGCASGSGDWVKPGIEDAEAAREYQDCRAAAAMAIGHEADIDQDIIASRQRDWQRGGIGRVQSRTMQEHTRDRVNSVVASCMRAKGFARAR